MTSPRVVTFGESMVVFNPAARGPLRYVHTFHRSLAGAESNVAIGVTRLGHSAGWFSRVGEDEFGRYVVQTLRGEGVDLSRVVCDPAAQTGICFKELPAAGDPAVIYYRRGSAASRMSPADIDESYIAGAGLLHVTGITPALSGSCRATVLAAAETARAAGVRVSFDPNYRRRLWSPEEARPVFIEIARRSDVILPGLDEGEIITGQTGAEAVARALLALGPSLVAVKLGAGGALLCDHEGCSLVPGFPVQPVDSVGAGDAFAAALLSGLLDSRTPLEAARRACAAGAMATQVIGDWEGMPDAAGLERFLAGGQVLTR